LIRLHAGIIERSAIDGQKLYHGELDNAMRMYIQEHQSEFIPEGVDVAAVAPGEPDTAESVSKIAKPLSGPDREHERNQRGLQWAWDTFDGAYQVAKHSTSEALELVRDAWDQSTSTTILYFVIVILVISNLWTFMMIGSREKAGKLKGMKKMAEKEKWVQGIVKGLWDEMAAGKGPAPPGIMPVHAYIDVAEHSPPSLPALPSSGSLREEITELRKTLDLVEERVNKIRERLSDLD
jgi:hypothetical protein